MDWEEDIRSLAVAITWEMLTSETDRGRDATMVLMSTVPARSIRVRIISSGPGSSVGSSPVQETETTAEWEPLQLPA